jgi:hypothetical protein
VVPDVKATPPARALAWSVDFLDRYWGPIGAAVVVALEVFVFAPRGMTVWMIGGGAVGAGLVIGWLAGYTP